MTVFDCVVLLVEHSIFSRQQRLILKIIEACTVLQGTVALEFLEQVTSLDCIIVPVSGGGLISGISIAAKSLKPELIIIAAEPTGAKAASLLCTKIDLVAVALLLQTCDFQPENDLHQALS